MDDLPKKPNEIINTIRIGKFPSLDVEYVAFNLPLNGRFKDSVRRVDTDGNMWKLVSKGLTWKSKRRRIKVKVAGQKRPNRGII